MDRFGRRSEGLFVVLGRRYIDGDSSRLGCSGTDRGKVWPHEPGATQGSAGADLSRHPDTRCRSTRQRPGRCPESSFAIGSSRSNIRGLRPPFLFPKFIRPQTEQFPCAGRHSAAQCTVIYRTFPVPGIPSECEFSMRGGFPCAATARFA